MTKTPIDHNVPSADFRFLPFLTTFTQLTARLNNFVRGWLLVLSLKEDLVECATVCVKSEVLLANIWGEGRASKGVAKKLKVSL